MGLGLAGLALAACSSEESTQPSSKSVAGAAGSPDGLAGGGAGGKVTELASGGAADERGDAGHAGDAGDAGDVGDAGDAGHVGSDPPEITSDTVSDMVFGAYCDLLAACEPELGPSFVSRTQCVQVMALGLSDGFDHPVFLAKRASLYEVERDLAETCLAKIERAGCTDGLPLTEIVETCHGAGGGWFFGNQLQHLLESFPECDAAMIGTLEEGACCDYRGGCGPGLFCERSDDVGTCLPAGVADEPCNTRPCEDGFVCVFGQCEALGQLGDACLEGYSPTNCAEGLYCDASQEPARCAAPDNPEGASCDCFNCAPGLYCPNEANPVCTAYKHEGDSCADGDECDPGLGCLNGTCRKQELLSLGEECVSGFSDCVETPMGSARCRDDGTGTERCMAPGLLGAPCDPNVDSDKTCASAYGLFCDATSRTCQRLPDVGESCEQVCADWFNVYCAYADPSDTNGTCQPRLGAGGDCSQDFRGQETEPVCDDGGCSSSSSSSSGSFLVSACQFDLECDETSRKCVAQTPSEPTCP